MKLLLLLLAFVADSAFADEWTVTTRTDGSGVYAMTVNQSGQVLTFTCDDGPEGKCFWFLGMDSTCATGSSYPILVNTNQGARTLELFCVNVPAAGASLYRYAFSDHAAFDALVRQRGILGIAFALKSGQFSVMRFDNATAPEALDSTMRQSIARSASSTKATKL